MKDSLQLKSKEVLQFQQLRNKKSLDKNKMDFGNQCDQILNCLAIS